MVPYLRCANVLDGEIDYSDVNQMHFSQGDQQRYTLRPGDILLNEGQSTELVGRSAIYQGPEGRYCYQNSLVNFRCGPAVVPRFAQAVFKRWLDVGHFGTIVKQTTSMAHLGGGRFSRLEFPIAPLPEQRQIAAILDTLDDAIRKTEQIIAKLKQVKQGLLHDLLTRGIDDNGELRCPERHPEQFKDSPLRRIPSGWEATTLGRHLSRCGGFLQTGPFGSQLHSYEYSASGVPVVMPQDISDDGVSIDSVARVPEQVAARLERHRMRKNDLLFARRGDLSRCAPIDAREREWLCGTGCLLARLPEHAVEAEWLASAYRHDSIQRQVAGRAVGSTMVNLNTGILQSLLLALPPLEEQRAISTVARTHVGRVGQETLKLAKLRLVKQGLMEDLLTGRVRVTALTTESPVP